MEKERRVYGAKSITRSPFALVAAIVIAIFVAEVQIMLILPFFVSPDSPYQEIADGLLLVVFLAPILYYMVYYSFVRQVREVRESAQKFHAVSHSAVDAIISINGAGEIVYWNKAAERMFGHAEDEALGKPVGLIIPKRYDEAHRQGLARVAAGGPYRLVGKTVTIEGVRKDGVEFPLELSLSAWEAGGKRYFTGIIRDITDRKAAEERLKVSEAALSKAQELAHLGNWELDIQTGKTAWSGELRRIYGIAPEEVEPTFDRFMGLVHPEDRKIIEEGMHRILSRKLSQLEFDMRIIRPDGQERDVLVKLEVVTDKDGKPAKLIGTNLDITERKRLEDANVRSKKLASIGILSAGVSHEILNPLNIIGTTAQLVMMDEQRGEIHEKMQSVLDQIQRAVKIVKGLGTFARQNMLEIDVAHLPDVFNRAAANMERDLKAGNIIIQRNFVPATVPIQGDAHLLEQVFSVLLSNARDAIGQRGNGTITVASRPVEHGMEFKFCDDGPGIPADIIEKVFDPFFTTKDPGKGTGLGLSIAHRIIEDHGGTMSVKSEPGKGACFTIFPPKDGEPKAW